MKTKLLGTLAILAGLFLCVGVAVAADADVLQPASDVIYNENVDINGSLNVDSLRVGTAGLGGVTYFNGTVLNEGTDPFTVGDDMRVDGEIWRGNEKGDQDGMPLKISDSMVPTADDMNSFGSSTNRWRKIFTKDFNFSGDIIPVTRTGWTRSDSNIGAEDKTIWKIWTDQADIRQASISQLSFYNQSNGEGEGYISDAGDDYSIGIQGSKGNIWLKATNDNNPASLELAEKTTLKFTPRSSTPYSCNSSHEGELFYDTSAGTEHRLKICDYRASAGGYNWRSL